MFTRKLKKLIRNPEMFFKDSKLCYRFLNNYYRVLKSSREQELIVSLTTFPPRAKFAKQTITSIFRQTLLPDRIIVWLAEDECGGKNIPTELVEFKSKGVEFKFVKESLRSYQKFIFTAQNYPESIIVTVDDDVIYSDTMLEKLYISYCKYPYDISCHRAHRIQFDKNMHALPYKLWKMRISDRTPSFFHLATGVGGVLYPPHALDSRVFDLKKIKEIAPTCDDLWFWAMEVLNGVKVRVVKDHNSKLIYAPGSQNLASEGKNQLHKINVEGDGNDVQFNAIIKEFPDIIKILQGRKIIYHQDIIDNSGVYSERSHIAFICDDNYVMPTVVSITSMIINKRNDTKYYIHVFADSISQENRDKIINACNHKNIHLDIIDFSSHVYKDLHSSFESKTLSASIAALQKFKIADSLPLVDKILFLDSDIIVRKDISEIYSIDISDVYGAAAFDTGIMYSKKTKQINDKSYFNSGVMLLNLKRMRKDDISSKLIDFKRNYSDKSLMDQHVFNCILKGKMKFFTLRYNLLYTNLMRAKDKYTMNRLNSLMHSDFDSLVEIRKQAVIIHFSSKDKPWKFYDTPLADEWHKYFEKSEFKELQLNRKSIKDGI